MNTINNGQWVITAAYALIGIAAYILARMFLDEAEVRAAQENLEDLRDKKASNSLVRLLRPFYSQYIVPTLRGRPFWDKSRRLYKRRVIAAGLKEEFTADEFIAFKFILILIFPVIGGLLKVLEFIDTSWFLILGSGALGWFFPNFWLNSLIKTRQKKVLIALPFVVDLLALSTEAGLDFVGAIAKVVEKAKVSPLIEELSQMLKEMKVGSSRQDALREMAVRLDMSAVNSFVAILISADQMGASIGRILRQQSEQIRSERMARAEKAGSIAAQMVLLPLVLFILPAVMLMIFGPFLLSFIYPNGA